MASRSHRPRAAKRGAPAPSPRTRPVTRIIVLSVLAVAVVAAATGFVVSWNLVRPFRTTVVVVDGTPIGMRYFLKRLAVSGEESLNLLDRLAKEEVLKQTAPKPPYNIAVSEQDIDQLARELARGDAEALDEREYREWYRQQLNETRFTDAEFRDLLRTELLIRRMTGYLAGQVPSTAEHVFLNMITVKDYTEGRAIKKRCDAGEDFAALARANSLDSTTKDSGGKVGWFPRGVLEAMLDSVAFGLAIGEVSDPLYLDEENVVLLMVSERVASRAIDEESRKVLESRALEVWLQEEIMDHQVELRGFSKGYDSRTDAWVNWQLSRMRKKGSAAGSTE